MSGIDYLQDCLRSRGSDEFVIGLPLETIDKTIQRRGMRGRHRVTGELRREAGGEGGRSPRSSQVRRSYSCGSEELCRFSPN